ncbi:MAG TPA: diguanylate cyclase, partial [Azospira sp.]|nr:diguanylate cyclase [Azospira sp.]
QSIDLRSSVDEARQVFAESPSLPLAIVTDDGQPIGLVRRGRVLSPAARSLGKLCEPVARNLPHRLTTPALARILYHDRKDSDPWVVTSNEGQYLGVIHPMTLIAQMLARRENGSNLHPLSHLPTGPSLRHTLESRLGEKQGGCLVYIDLDHFKAYNVRYGFIRGDAMIRTLAELLRHTFVGRPDCLLGHIGGDDFILVLEDMNPALVEELLSIMEQFQSLAAHLYDPEDIARGHFLTEDGLSHPIASISVAVVNASTGRLPNAVAAAERAAALKKVGKVEQGSVIVVEGLPPSLVKQQGLRDLGQWKLNAISALNDFVAAPRSRDPHALDAWFRSYPFFEMIFELDGAGVQRFPNWINPDMYGRIKAGGVGVDRAEQPYFRQVAASGRPYVSEIYLSSATEDFCITLAVPLGGPGTVDGVLVADINIGSMASLTQRHYAKAA